MAKRKRKHYGTIASEHREKQKSAAEEGLDEAYRAKMLLAPKREDITDVACRHALDSMIDAWVKIGESVAHMESGGKYTSGIHSRAVAEANLAHSRYINKCIK